MSSVALNEKLSGKPDDSVFVDIHLGIDDIKMSTRNSIDKIIDRGENIDDLKSKTELLSESSSIFNNKTKEDCKYCRDNKLMIIKSTVFGIVVIFILIMTLTLL